LVIPIAQELPFVPAHLGARVITQCTAKLQVRIMQTSETATHMGANSQQFKKLYYSFWRLFCKLMGTSSCVRTRFNITIAKLK
jgi:hypothetical protein